MATHDLEMDIHFAGTATEVELNLGELLAPGIYTLAAELRDVEYDIEAVGSAQFEVTAPAREGSAIPGRDRLEDALRDAGLPSWLLLMTAGLVLLLTIAGLAMLVVHALRRRRRSARPAPDARPEEAGGPVPPRTALPSDPPTLSPPRNIHHQDRRPRADRPVRSRTACPRSRLCPQRRLSATRSWQPGGSAQIASHPRKRRGWARSSRWT